MIKKVEDKVTEKKTQAQKTMSEQVNRQRHAALTNLANQIRYVFQMRRTGTMQINILIEQLNERRQNSEFVDKQERLR